MSIIAPREKNRIPIKQIIALCGETGAKELEVGRRTISRFSKAEADPIIFESSIISFAGAIF